MVVYNYSGKEINAKIVYYGPALSGKTTNLEWIYSKIPLEYSGKMISLRTQTDRTIFFDFLPLELGLIDGFKTRFMLYTVPGQVYYNATRKMVLKGVDGVVFVADSEDGRLADNLESFQNLKDNLTEIGLDPESIPLVMQWNKRDLANTMSVEELERELNPSGLPSFEACALTGEGVYETLHQISRMIYLKLTTGEESAAQASSRGAVEATSLFGDDIAARLQDVDRPAEIDPTMLESVALDENYASPSAPGDGAVLDTILGSVASSARGVTAVDTPTPVEESSAGGLDEIALAPDTEARAAAANANELSALDELEFPEPEVMEPALVVARVDEFAQPDQRGGAASGGLATGRLGEGHVPAQAIDARGSTPMADQSQSPAGPPSQWSGPTRPVQPAAYSSGSFDPSALDEPMVAPSPAPQASGGPDDAVSDLVDNLFTPVVEPDAGGDPPERSTSKFRPLEETAGETDDPTYGNSFGRMVDLDGNGVAPPVAEPELAPPSPASEAGESLDLITDPLKVANPESAGVEPVGDDEASERFQPVGGFNPAAAGAKTIEIPVTIDADALSDGNTIRVVLNLNVRR